MITYKEVKSIFNKHKKRVSWFVDDYSIKPYEYGGFNCIMSLVFIAVGSATDAYVQVEESNGLISELLKVIPKQRSAKSME